MSRVKDPFISPTLTVAHVLLGHFLVLGQLGIKQHEDVAQSCRNPCNVHELRCRCSSNLFRGNPGLQDPSNQGILAAALGHLKEHPKP